MDVVLSIYSCNTHFVGQQQTHRGMHNMIDISFLNVV